MRWRTKFRPGARDGSRERVEYPEKWNYYADGHSSFETKPDYEAQRRKRQYHSHSIAYRLLRVIQRSFEAENFLENLYQVASGYPHGDEKYAEPRSSRLLTEIRKIGESDPHCAGGDLLRLPEEVKEP